VGSSSSDEKVFDMDGEEGFSRCLGIELVGWVAWGKTGRARICFLICKHLHN
jgi:hypothetical protein